MHKNDLYVGQIVKMSAPGRVGKSLVRVEKINPKNIKVIKENGEKWNVHPLYLFPVTDEERDSFTLTEAPGASLVMGAVVKFKGVMESKSKYPLLVVVGQHGEGYRLAPLGGDGGRYYRGISASQIEIVNFDVAGV